MKKTIHDDIMVININDLSMTPISQPTEQEVRSFDPSTSAEKVKAIYKRWTTLTDSLSREILLAYTALKPKDNEFSVTFADWCETAELPDHRIVKGWILKFLDPDRAKELQDEAKSKREVSLISKSIGKLLKEMEFEVLQESEHFIRVKINYRGVTDTRDIKR